MLKKLLIVGFSILVVVVAIYSWVKFGTYHGVMTVDPKTGEYNLEQLCSGKEFVLTYGEFFMCR